MNSTTSQPLRTTLRTTVPGSGFCQRFGMGLRFQSAHPCTGYGTHCERDGVWRRGQATRGRQQQPTRWRHQTAGRARAAILMACVVWAQGDGVARTTLVRWR